jgi:hypothetical protein
MPVLDGVLKSRDYFGAIRRAFASSLDYGPQCHGRCFDDLPAERDIIKIVMEVRPTSAMARIASLPKSRSAVFPPARATDIVAAFVREEHVGASIETLGVSLEAPGVRREQRQVGVVRHDNEHVDVLRIGLRGDNRTHKRNPPDAGSATCSRTLDPPSPTMSW